MQEVVNLFSLSFVQICPLNPVTSPHLPPVLHPSIPPSIAVQTQPVYVTALKRLHSLLKESLHTHTHTHAHTLPCSTKCGWCANVCFWGLLFVLTYSWCMCVCLCVCVCVCMCVCVSGQRHRRRGRGGGSCHCSIQGKQCNFTAIWAQHRHKHTICFWTNNWFTNYFASESPPVCF